MEIMDQNTINVQTSYDRIAGEYTAHIAGELAHKPLDRHLLSWFAERVQGLGPVWDLGCGPGHVARYLHDRGVDVRGLDLSAEMIAQARQLHPEIVFAQGNMRSLEVETGILGGIVAFYSLIHIPHADMVAVLNELKRALRHGGALLLSFHIGQEIVHRDEMWEQPVTLDFIFFQTQEMFDYLNAAGFTIEMVLERAPYVEAEHPSRRAYICAAKPV
jgi:SAM-dependent methyltransferase